VVGGGGVRNRKANWNIPEKWRRRLRHLPRCKILAYRKDQLVFPSQKVVASKQWSIGPPVGVCPHLQNQIRSPSGPTKERNAKPVGRSAGNKIQNMRGQLPHLLSRYDNVTAAFNKAGHRKMAGSDQVGSP